METKKKVGTRREKTRDRTTGDEKAEHRKRIDRTISRRHKAEMKRENERYNGYSEIRILSDRGIRDLREIQLPRKSRIMANNENYRLITYHRTSKKNLGLNHTISKPKVDSRQKIRGIKAVM